MANTHIFGRWSGQPNQYPTHAAKSYKHPNPPQFIHLMLFDSMSSQPPVCVPCTRPPKGNITGLGVHQPAYWAPPPPSTTASLAQRRTQQHPRSSSYEGPQCTALTKTHCAPNTHKTNKEGCTSCASTLGEPQHTCRPRNVQYSCHPGRAHPGAYHARTIRHTHPVAHLLISASVQNFCGQTRFIHSFFLSHIRANRP